MNAPVTEAELQAWIDGQLAAERHEAVGGYLALHPAEAARLQAYREQNAALRALYHPVLAEPVPTAWTAPRRTFRQRGWQGWQGWLGRAVAPRGTPLRPEHEAGVDAGDGAQANPRWPRPLRAAALLALTLAGGSAGWVLRGALDSNGAPLLADTSPGAALPLRAALAHAVYTPEVRHPVEVGADQEAHLVAWLSKRLGAPLKPPRLAAQGYQLEGGRLLPGQSGPVAQFMYRDAGGARLTLYVSTEQTHGRETGFRFAQEGDVGVFYWIDGKFGYALSGSLDKAALAKLANAVYAQLEPAS
jgi:anti-sigma factor RsiW